MDSVLSPLSFVQAPPGKQRHLLQHRLGGRRWARGGTVISESQVRSSPHPRAERSSNLAKVSLGTGQVSSATGLKVAPWSRPRIPTPGVEIRSSWGRNARIWLTRGSGVTPPEDAPRAGAAHKCPEDADGYPQLSSNANNLRNTELYGTPFPGARPCALLAFGAHRRPLRQPRDHRTAGRGRLESSQSAAWDRHCPWGCRPRSGGRDRGLWKWRESEIKGQQGNYPPPTLKCPLQILATGNLGAPSPIHPVAVSLSLSKSFPVPLSLVS